MNPRNAWLIFALVSAVAYSPIIRAKQEPQAPGPDVAAERTKLLPKPIQQAYYVFAGPSNLVSKVEQKYWLTWIPEPSESNSKAQWLMLTAQKPDGSTWSVWWLTSEYPSDSIAQASQQISRYILQPSKGEASEFKNRTTGLALLPSIGGWSYLLPRPPSSLEEQSSPIAFPRRTVFLGHPYELAKVDTLPHAPQPPLARLYELNADVLIGLPSNSRQRDERRRYDGSDYESIRLNREDYRQMAEAGINCMRVDKEQREFLNDLDVFHWGLNSDELLYPECLYDSRYLGPSLFLDEPAVSTRDYIIRPRLEKDEAFRKSFTPRAAFDAYREYFDRVTKEGAPSGLLQSLRNNSHIDVGDMNFTQANLYTWETFESVAAYELSRNPVVPAAFVFEPPGRLGTRRTLPEMDMSYGCQIPADNPNFFIDIIYGFLRGAARVTGKNWGTSIYGAVDRADAFWFMTRAYDLGATRFFFWDNAQLACVPFHECLAISRALRMRTENYPNRDLHALKHAAEVGIILPTGYNFGHVSMGKGNLWGLAELNLERLNPAGVKYRTVMGNFFTEIERCLRLGVAFDLFGDYAGLQPAGYRELIRIREDGKVEVTENGHRTVLDQPRIPARPVGPPPKLTVTLSTREGKAPLALTARATATETSAPIFYTLGADSSGVYQNAAVAWELYGPREDEYRAIVPVHLNPATIKKGNAFEARAELKLTRAGDYRLRTVTVDVAGRSTVVWSTITVSE